MIETKLLLKSLPGSISQQLEKYFQCEMMSVLDIKIVYKQLMHESSVVPQSSPNFMKIESETIEIIKETQVLRKQIQETDIEIIELQKQLKVVQTQSGDNKLTKSLKHDRNIDISQFIQYQQRILNVKVQEAQVTSAFQINKIISDIQTEEQNDLSGSTEKLALSQTTTQLSCQDQLRTLQITLMALERTLKNDYEVLSNIKNIGYENMIVESEGTRNSAEGFSMVINHISCAEYWLIFFTMVITCYFVFFAQ